MSKAAEVLKAEVNGLPELSVQGCSPSERVWREHVNRIRRHILMDDPSRFLTWPPVVSTMAPIRNCEYYSAFRHYLAQLPDWESKWKLAIKEVPIGTPTYFGNFPKSSGCLLGSAVCLAQFEQRVGVSVKDLPFVFEFGGGYGCLRCLLDRLGFRGKYMDFDFAVMSALKRFYLTEVGIYDSSDSLDLFLSDWDRLELALENLPENSLFLSGWALSETPLAVRTRIVSLVEKFSYFLLAYQPEFHEMNNARYFSALQTDLCNIDWQSVMMPGLASVTILIGKRKNCG